MKRTLSVGDGADTDWAMSVGVQNGFEDCHSKTGFCFLPQIWAGFGYITKLQQIVYASKE